MVATYVDDFLVFARTTAKANSILDELETKMKLKRQGEMSFFLGITIEYDQNDGKITLTQEAYARKILAPFGMTTCHGYTTPEVDDREDLWHDSSQPSTDQETYRSMVGSLMYLMTCTRPDISHAVQRLSRHLHDPRVPTPLAPSESFDMSSTQSALDSSSARLTPTSSGTATQAGRQDLTDGRPQALLALSVAASCRGSQRASESLRCQHAEYVALAELAKEVVWLRGLLEDMNMKQEQATLTWCDNKAAISTAENVGVASRSKHIDVRHHFIRQLIQANVLDLRHVGTADQLADVLTKVSTRAAIDKFKTVAMNPENKNGMKQLDEISQSEDDSYQVKSQTAPSLRSTSRTNTGEC
ncbi:hypothetical protein LEN26_012596 [Aphanomyces euteiches]|nr:hypothetical protein LEN26_012596 [Aphanomyces euteiches]